MVRTHKFKNDFTPGIETGGNPADLQNLLSDRYVGESNAARTARRLRANPLLRPGYLTRNLPSSIPNVPNAAVARRAIIKAAAGTPAGRAIRGLIRAGQGLADLSSVVSEAVAEANLQNLLDREVDIAIQPGIDVPPGVNIGTGPTGLTTIQWDVGRIVNCQEPIGCPSAEGSATVAMSQDTGGGPVELAAYGEWVYFKTDINTRFAVGSFWRYPYCGRLPVMDVLPTAKAFPIPPTPERTVHRERERMQRRLRLPKGNIRFDWTSASREPPKVTIDPLPVRPSKGQLERKSALPAALGAALKAAYVATEVADFIEVLYKASGGWSGRNTNGQLHWLFVQGNISNIELGAFLKEYVANEIEDQLIGRAHAANARRMRERGLKNAIKSVL